MNNSGNIGVIIQIPNLGISFINAIIIVNKIYQLLKFYILSVNVIYVLTV